MITKLKQLISGQSIRADVIKIYMIQFLTLGIGLIGSVIVARSLGPSEKGIIDLFNLLNSFILDFGLLGFGSGLLYHFTNIKRGLTEVHGTGFVFVLLIGFLTALVGYFGLPLWVNFFPGLNTWIILVAFFLAPIAYYRLIWSNIMTGYNRATLIYRIGFYLTVLNLLMVITIWGLGLLTAKNIVFIGVILTLISGVVSFITIYREEHKFTVSIPLFRDSFRYGITIYLGTIANVLHFKIDQVLINQWLGTGAVGIYAVSVRWAEMLFVLDGAIISAALYKISTTTPEESYSLTKRLSKVQFIISGGSAIILTIIAYPLILILYGDAYRNAVLPLILLIPGVVAWSVSKLYSGMLTYNSNFAGFITRVSILGFLINIVLNYLSIKIIGLGLIGASMASSLSYLLVTLIIWRKFNSIKRSGK